MFIDIDGELNFSYTFTDSSILTADLSSNHLVLSSIDDISGDTELMITATNPTRASVTDTVQISVWPVNDHPIIDSIPDIVMDEDSELYIYVEAESEQGYNIYFDAYSDTSSVDVYAVSYTHLRAHET